MQGTEGDSVAFPIDIAMVKMQNYPPPMVRFFYERPDGSILDCSEQEAAKQLRHSKKFQSYRLVGIGDGKAQIASLKACGVKPGERIPYEKARKIQQEAFAAELAAARLAPLRHPRLAEWAYPDGSVPQHERAGISLPTNE